MWIAIVAVFSRQQLSTKQAKNCGFGSYAYHQYSMSCYVISPLSITAEAAKKCKKKARYSRSHSGQKSGAGGIRYYQ
jgi:hypothetical protein